MKQASLTALELMRWEWETGQARATVASKLMAIATKKSHAGGMVADNRDAQVSAWLVSLFLMSTVPVWQFPLFAAGQ